MRHVAMEQEITGQLLAKTGSALCLQVQRLGRTDNFHINSIGLRADDRILDRTVHRCGPEIHIINGSRAPWPSDRPTMWMMAMEHF